MTHSLTDSLTELEMAVNTCVAFATKNFLSSLYDDETMVAVQLPDLNDYQFVAAGLPAGTGGGAGMIWGLSSVCL